MGSNESSSNLIWVENRFAFKHFFLDLARVLADGDPKNRFAFKHF